MRSRPLRNFSKIKDAIEVPDLTEVQLKGYNRFLQGDVAHDQRQDIGLEALFREVFPIVSYDKTIELGYLGYELEKPRYTIEECKELRLSYAYPLKVRCSLKRKDAADVAEQAIYLGEIPIMIGGGEFIINGAERVIVNQLHRSPGVDFVIDSKDGDRLLHGARIIPERGSWIEISVTRKDVMVIRIDQSSKIPAVTFLRAMDEKYGKTEDIIRLFYKTQTVKTKKLEPTMWSVGQIVDTETGEILVEAGAQIGDALAAIQGADLSSGQTQAEKINSANEVVDALLKYKQKEKLDGWFDVPEDKEIRALLKENPLSLVVAVLCMRLIDHPYEDALSLSKGLGGLDVKEIANKTVDEIKQYLSGQTAPKAAEAIIAFCKLIVDKYKGKVEAFWRNRTAKEVVEEFGSLPQVGPYKLKFLLANMLHSKSNMLPYAQKFPDPENIEISVDRHVFNAAKYLGLVEVESLTDNKTKTKIIDAIRELYPIFPGELDAPLWKLGKEYGEEDSKYKEWLRERKLLRSIKTGSLDAVEVIAHVVDPLILNTLAEDGTDSHEAALAKIYARLRPGNPANAEKAKQLFEEKFYDTNRYRLGRVGRFRLNRKFGTSVDLNEMRLCSEDFLQTMNYVLGLRSGAGELDDIDHLGNRRLRTIEELAAVEVRKGLLKLRRTVQERMSSKTAEEISRIADLVNSKSVSSSIEFFFGRGELSQVVDQTNALSQLAHERRLSALGPGGLNRKRAGFEVRDVHISHYGRVCPIETPEGTNIGLIVSLSIFSKVDEYGFLVTPYCKVHKKKVSDEVAWLRADEEMNSVFAPPTMVNMATNTLREGVVLARRDGDLTQCESNEVGFVDVSSKQMVGVSAALVPFLEHDDANRALMGSNMQRQAVPLLTAEAPLVGTGMEVEVAKHSSMVVKARQSGTVTAVDAANIVINQTDEYPLRKFTGLNERTCLNQKPIVTLGQKVEKGQVIADGGGTSEGVLALGRNVLMAFVPFDGYNFEDAILISERLVKWDVFTSIHIDEFSVDVRETKLGHEEFTRDIPNVGEKTLRNLDERGIIREGTRVAPGDVLVGKVSPKSKTELTPEEKLLHAIFGRAGEDVKNDSLEVPSGYEGVVIKTRHFRRRAAENDEQRKALKEQMKAYQAEMVARQCDVFKRMMAEIHAVAGTEAVDPSTRQKVGVSDNVEVISEQIDNFDIAWIKPVSARGAAQKLVNQYWPKITALKEEQAHELDRMKHGDELPSGVLEMVKLYIATKRTLSIGDKVAGRHGNKGVIAKILPAEDMPFMEDGTPVDICLNPLGVPSRMNVGQILETLLGWAGKILGFDAITPVFAGAEEEDIAKVIEEANAHIRGRVAEIEEKKAVPPVDEIFVQMPPSLGVQLYDGRTGEPFDQQATVGFMYILKLHHLVDDKIHARSTGPYSLITQQPLGGKARTGGQRFGEMEVWALEAYGAAYTLQELLTVKSDDIEGRTKIYESMVKGTNTLEAGTPISFDVLCNELRGLGLNIQLEKKRVGSTAI